MGYDGAMLIRSLISQAVRRLANDPRVKAKARELAQNHARPMVNDKLEAMRQVAREAEPGAHPARVAGRALKKLLDG